MIVPMRTVARWALAIALLVAALAVGGQMSSPFTSPYQTTVSAAAPDLETSGEPEGTSPSGTHGTRLPFVGPGAAMTAPTTIRTWTALRSASLDVTESHSFRRRDVSSPLNARVSPHLRAIPLLI